MILHPGVLALIVGSSIIFLLMLIASGVAIEILIRWNYQSSSEQQYILEKKTYLISSLVNCALAFVILSCLLFAYTVDDIHTLFVGAMCATGSLNANPIGWYALFTKGIVFFAAAIWLAINYFDQRSEDYPLIKLKYSILLIIAPLLGFDLYFQLKYFLGLQPEIITSCCGSLFTKGGTDFASELVSLPVIPAMWGFYSTIFLFICSTVLFLIYKISIIRYATSVLSLATLLVSLAAIVSFISLYIYELPTHHCPFDILQQEYNFIGYPIYISLFAGVLFGLLPGIFQPFKKIPSLKQQICLAEKKWAFSSLSFIIIFLIITSWPVIFGNLTLKAYF